MRIGKEGRIFLIFVMILMWTTLYAAQSPMESISRYNVILVHGAGDSLGGMNCSEVTYKETYLYRDSVTGLPQKIGGIGDHSSATGIIKLMAPWFRDTIFEDPSAVYLQRPFTNPAGFPVENGKEIGKRSWIGTGKCSQRRSLIEEAQEFRAKGCGCQTRSHLLELRTIKKFTEL